MKSVASVLRSKPNQTVHTIAPDASVRTAIELMARYGVGSLVVFDAGQIVGMLTERDYARKVVLLGRVSDATPVRDIMTSPVLYVRPDQTNDQCMALMTESRIRHLPVVDNGKMIGLISIGDLVKDIISEQRFMIEQLENYITGR